MSQDNLSVSIISLKEGMQLGSYVLDGFLGRGSFKQVWKAHLQSDTDTIVALAIPFRQDAESKKDLQHEINLASRLHHPNITQLFSFQETDELFFVVMEYVEGDTLKRICDVRKKLAEPEAIEYGLAIARAIEHAHRNGICHSDIKPGNVIVDSKRSLVKLLDFGLSRIIGSDIASISQVVGTILFMAPEVQKNQMHKKSDIWSLGITLYYLVKGEFPFTKTELSNTDKMLSLAISGQDPDMSDDYAQVIKGCLQYDPTARSSAEIVVKELERLSRKGILATGIEGEIELRLRSNTTLLYITTYEENRVEELLRRLIKKMSKGITGWHFFSWSQSRGLCESDGRVMRPSPSGVANPNALIDSIHECSPYSIILVKDYHHFIEHPLFIRNLRDSLPDFSERKKIIVFVSPVSKIPKELEKYIFVTELGLPDAKALMEVFDRLIENNKIKEQLQFKGDEKSRFVSAAVGLTLNEAENAFARAIIRTKGKLSGESIRIIIEEKKQLLKKAEMLEFYPAGESFQDIGGLGKLKAWFHTRLKAYSDDARSYGLPYPRGIMLIGVPGCGKSLSARALAAEWEVPLLRFDMTRLFSSFVGATEQNLIRALKVAESVAPCVLWIDEIEKGFGAFGGSDVHGVTSHIFGYFLSWLQEKKAPVFVIATANRIIEVHPTAGPRLVLPPELLRKGRWDEVFFIDLPDPNARTQILEIHLRKHNQELPRTELMSIAGKTLHFSGAELESLVINALYKAFAEQKAQITYEMMEASISEIIPLAKQREAEIHGLRDWGKGRAQPAD